MRRNILVLSLALRFIAPALAQNVSSSIHGTLVDPSGAVVPGASCALTNQSTGAVLTAASSADGSFVFPNVLAGVYDLKVAAAGFKTFESSGIVVTASETRALGELPLQLGEVTEAVSVQAEPAAVQLGSAERSGIITGDQLKDIAVKGRDFFALMLTVPGIVDTFTRTRETMDPSAPQGTFINGGRQMHKNVTVDGVTNLDVGSNNGMHYQPNMDSIAEVKILTTNYQAEFGRNAGGTISVITKSGTRNFHGTVYDFYRHESLNAGEFFDNKTGTAKSPYRYRITGYSLEGPVTVPGRFNRDRNKLFFFWSQEYTGMKKDYGTKFVNMPTAVERQGDFSHSFDLNGALIAIRDPLAGRPFPGNIVPKDRISKLGQSILNFYPLPNYEEADPAYKNRRNYRSFYSGPYNKRQDMVRVDAAPWASLQVYYRFIRDSDQELRPYGLTGTYPNYPLSPVVVARPGKGHAFHATKVFSPTLINELTFGKNYNRGLWDIENKQAVDRSKMGNPPTWSAGGGETAGLYIPDVTFGGTPVNAVNSTLGNVPFINTNDAFSLADNVSKVWRSHTLKAGIYIERTGKFQPGSRNRGTFNFGRDAYNPSESNHGYANALLGNFQYYTQTITPPRDKDWWLRTTEWYVQDNWKAARRLTIDAGLRFYHLPPVEDLLGGLATWDPKFYDPAKTPAMYLPAIDPVTKRRVAKNPLTGALAPAPLIGNLAPGSGDFANGIAVGGKNGYPAGLYTTSWLKLGPRLGFAYDLTGKGRTALRGGFGVFIDRSNSNHTYNTTLNPPFNYTSGVLYGDLATYTLAEGSVTPLSLFALLGHVQQPATMNFSLGLQHRVRSTLIDAAYVGGLSRHLLERRNLNAIAMYSRFDPANQDPTQPGVPLPDPFFTPIKGYQSIGNEEFAATSNYNSFQLSVNRRFTRGLQFGLAYTWSKALGIIADDNAGGVSSYFPARQRNYGVLDQDRRHVFVFNYVYALPNPGKRYGKLLGWVADRWQLSGSTSFISGAPFTPTFSTTDATDITGSNEAARITVVGNPYLPKSERTFDRNFNPAAFARTPVRSFGNAGIGMLTGPGVNNWDLAMSKRVRLWADSSFFQFRVEFFNAFNHTQFSGVNAAFRFDPRGVNLNTLVGSYSAARQPRIIQFSGRLSF